MRRQDYSLPHTKSPVWLFSLAGQWAHAHSPALRNVPPKYSRPHQHHWWSTNLLQVCFVFDWYPHRKHRIFISKKCIAILCLTGSSEVVTILLPLRGQWTKFTRILLLETTILFYLFLLFSSRPSLHFCTHVCACESTSVYMRVSAWMCVHGCVHVYLGLRARPHVQTCTKYCRMSRDIFLPCFTFPPKSRFYSTEFTKGRFPCFWEEEVQQGWWVIITYG